MKPKVYSLSYFHQHYLLIYKIKYIRDKNKTSFLEKKLTNICVKTLEMKSKGGRGECGGKKIKINSCHLGSCSPVDYNKSTDLLPSSVNRT